MRTLPIPQCVGREVDSALFAFFRFATIVVVAALLGGGSSLVAVTYVSEFWSDLGWRRPVAVWLMSIPFGDRVAGYWGLVWLCLPEWLIAGMLGVVLGICLRSKWFIGAFPCALAYVSAVHLWSFVTGQPNLLVSFGPRILLKALFWDLPGPILMILAAYALSGGMNEGRLSVSQSGAES